jgi:hypothetical protein
MRTFEATITPQGSTLSHQVRIQAKTQDEAKKILKLQYPGCYIGFVRHVG